MSNWINSLLEIPRVQKIENSRDLITIIFNDNKPNIIAYKNNKSNLTARELESLIKQKGFNFLLCFNDQYCLDSSCIELLKKLNITYGNSTDFGNILRNSQLCVQNFTTPETQWILNNLPNHSNVAKATLVANRKILVHRTVGKKINLVFLNEYELSESRINEVFDYYSPIDIILSTNPNIEGFGTINFNEKMVKTVKWRELFSLMNTMP